MMCSWHGDNNNVFDEFVCKNEIWLFMAHNTCEIDFNADSRTSACDMYYVQEGIVELIHGISFDPLLSK